MKTLYLIDISSFIFRAFFAIRKLTTAKGTPVNAVYGVTTMMLNLLEKHKPDAVACVFDTPAPSFRKELFADYKANRGAPPDELIPQFDLISRLIETMGIPKIIAPGFEADDLIATMARKFPKCEVVIVTGDNDLMQLVNEHVKVLDTMKDVLYGAAEVKQKMGVEPKLIPDYLGLIGDSSDNIPGVKGIGPKGAVELIDEFGTLENILKSTSKMKPGKKREVLEESHEIALLSKKLATVREDLVEETKNYSLESLATPKKFEMPFAEFLLEMEFKSLHRKHFGDVAIEPTAQLKNKEVIADSERTRVTTAEVWNKLAEELLSKKEIICESSEGALLISSGGKEYDVELSSMKKVYEDLYASKALVVGHDLKRLHKAALVAGVSAPTVLARTAFFDIMLAHYLVEPEGKHEIEVLVEHYLASSFMSSPLQNIAGVYPLLKNELYSQELAKLFDEIEMPTAAVLAVMEWYGVRLDVDVLGVLSKEYAQELKGIETKITEIVGYPFNLNSPKQLSTVLFEKLKLPVISKTKTGFSTDAETLAKLAPMHPVPDLILRNRELTKLKGTYIDVLPTLVSRDERLRAHFNQAVAATGRLSGSDPNLQNIPIKTESGRKIRKAFIADEGNVLVGADYSQIELRIVAHMSGDEALLGAFKKELDVHSATAAEIFHVKLEEVTSKQRSAAKAINFGLIYGKTAFGLAQELGIPRHEAQTYIDLYFKRYSGVKAFMDKCIADARTHKMSQTLFGRKRPIRDIDSKNMGVRNNAERMAMNTPVQGTAADIIKIAMIRVARAAEEIGAKLVLSVHDELVLEVSKKKTDEAKAILKREMEGAVKLSIPLTVDANVADNWMDL